MSSVKTWLTKEEVMRDLAQVSGRRMVARLQNLDNNFLVSANAPPPVMYEAEDEEEMRLILGDALHSATESCENIAPDLQGITDMLRLVQGPDANGDEEDTQQQSNYVIAISKLNPKVQEFIPKGAISSHTSSDVSETNSPTVDTAVNDTKNVDPKIEINKNDNEDLTTNAVGCTTSYSKTKTQTGDFKTDTNKIINEDLVTKLKNEISNASKSNTFEKKRARNLAITTLLKLCSTTNNKPVAVKPKLITPDYFESPISADIQEKVEPEKKTLPSAPTSPGPKSIPSTTTSSNDVRSEPALSTQNITKRLKPKLDPVVKKSIEKVNNWLGEESTERKSPAIYLGPISFKKKEPTNSNMANSTDAKTSNCDNKVLKSSQQNQYQPSNYAADLERKYTERSKTKKQKQKVNAWADLDIILKEKDEKVKQKLAQGTTSDRDLYVSLEQ